MRIHWACSPSPERVVVSTDDDEFAAISQKYGAKEVWQPVEISGDVATSESVLLRTLGYLPIPRLISQSL